MNEVTRLRNKHQDFGESEYDEECDEDGSEGDDLNQWYKSEVGHQAAAGVGELDYGE